MSDDQSKGVHIIALSEHLKTNPLVTTAFTCGDKYLDKVAQKQLIPYDSLDKFRAFVALTDNTLVGYVTLAPKQIEPEPDFPQKGFKTMPVLFIEHIATDKQHQGKGIGSRLLSKAFNAAVRAHSHLPIAGVALWAHPDALEFYKRHNFKAYQTMEQSGLELTLMYLPITTLLDATD